eukprot:TRINITY_DN11183_c0_g1_i2.p1 TRINITY_DN11183_c0_g1~~TRINITY_DN11183_c0_g1_i2.p1  ORF type:complete len:261 (-),score=14.07 TRINITY_DN11183_c0_g1_i2:196-921(-)
MEPSLQRRMILTTTIGISYAMSRGGWHWAAAGLVSAFVLQQVHRLLRRMVVRKTFSYGTQAKDAQGFRRKQELLQPSAVTWGKSLRVPRPMTTNPNCDEQFLRAVYIASPKQTTSPGLLLIVSHGKGHDLVDQEAKHRALMLSSVGVSVLYYDYCGYGGSDGICSEENCYADLRAVLRYAEQTLSWNRNQIVLVGQSLGTGPTLEILAAGDAAGVRGPSPSFPLALRWRSWPLANLRTSVS